MKKVLIFTFLGCISLLHGQRLPYPFLYHVTSRCNVTYSKINELYNYNYIVINDTTNKGTITEIDLDISRGPISVNYDTLGLTFYSKLSELYFRRYYPRLVNRIVPVGFPTFPKKGWFAIVGNNPETGILTDSLGIVPGQTVNNIILTSKALPGIKNIRFVPDFWDDYYFQYDDTTNTDDIDSVRHVINFYGNTVGPTAPPINFIPTVWCDTLTSYSTQSRTMGWIKDDATKNKYLSYFASAKTKLLQQDNIGARTVLLQALKDIDLDSTANPATQTAGKLTSEAYALISYNTKYLLAQLPILIVKLVNSTGSLLTTGTLQYNDSTWENATNNNDGTFTIISSKKKLSLRMTYAYGTQTKSNVTIGSDTIVFQTKNISVNLQNSQGNPLDTGIVQYNANGWQDFGTTSNGIVTKELLPTKYNFRMTYNSATVSKAQNIDSNATVVFQTVPAKVELLTSTGAPLDTGIVQFNAGGWKNFGMTLNGAATKEILPTKYNFRITYDGATVSKAQNIDSNATVIFQTVKTLVQFNNSKGTPLDTGIVQFNSGGWQNFGNTSNGVISKELLPVKYTFKLTYNGSSVSIAQSIDSNATVVFSTVLCTVSVTNTAGSLLNNATVSYNAGGPNGASWKLIGTTTNGIVTIELLPVKIQFRAAYGTKQQSVTQDVSINPLVAITLPVQ